MGDVGGGKKRERKRRGIQGGLKNGVVVGAGGERGMLWGVEGGRAQGRDDDDDGRWGGGGGGGEDAEAPRNNGQRVRSSSAPPSSRDPPGPPYPPSATAGPPPRPPLPAGPIQPGSGLSRPREAPTGPLPR